MNLPPNIKPQNAFFWLRLYLCCSTFVVNTITLTASASLNAQMASKAGQGAIIVTVLLLCCAAVALADLCINDVLPDSWNFRFALEHRHLGYVAIASLNLSFIFTMAKVDAITVLAARYLLDAVFCAFVAWAHILINHPQSKFPAIDRRKGSNENRNLGMP